MDDALLKEIAEDIGELKGMMSAMQVDLTSGKKQFSKHDSRIKRIELWFIPVLGTMSLAVYLIIEFGRHMI